MSAEPGDTPRAPFRDAERGGTALLIIDMISPFDFSGAEALLPELARAAGRIAALREAAARADVPVIYVNDNFGEWHSEASRLYERAAEEGSRGREIATLLKPDARDYFIIKPQFSGFYSTNLPVLLPKLGVSRLILTGLAADICVLFTAADAHMRDYALWVPEDTVVAHEPERCRWALEIMRHSMRAETRASDAYPLDAWLEAGQATEAAPDD
ncbi:cysteine hydrolase family protein [Sphingomonas bacterium]|uniref:cysteine hydrolase family protein n=1 Tax=Sphingomonas bacterium TaxID=1895847 RepID=UPI001575ABB1|nr:isochorismatase family cysteine hydrolase [Sphingomonas bacterium]